MNGSTTHETYRAARDQLLKLRAAHDLAVQQFSWPHLDGPFNWAHDWFDVIARDNDGIALHIVEEDETAATYSFDTLARRSTQVARWLAAHGVRRGESVVVMLGNQVELWECMLAVMKLGAVIVPTTPALGAADLPERLARTTARHVITSVAHTSKFDRIADGLTRIAVAGPHSKDHRGDDHDYHHKVPPGWLEYTQSHAISEGDLPHPDTHPAERLLLYFTSGTTSRPKLVEHTHESYPVGHLSTMYWLGLRPGDIHLNISSPGWAKHAWSCLFAPWIAEATIFIYNYTRFDAAALLRQIRTHRVSSFCAPPTVWRMLIKSDLSGGPGSLHEVIAAGEPLNPEVIDQVHTAWGLTLRDGFGQTETAAQIGNTPGSPVKPGSMGRPLPGVPVILLDPATAAPSDIEGEICLNTLLGNPVNLMSGYCGDEERNTEAMLGGYYHTGDIARRDADGYLFYIGRDDDVFKASDYKVSPFELESVLIEHPAVAEAAVVPAPDATRLAVPKAYVALAAGWEPDRLTALAILQHARDNLPPYLRVRRLEFYDLPKTISGKIQRAALRARERDDPRIAAQHEWRDEQFSELTALGPVCSAGRTAEDP